MQDLVFEKNGHLNDLGVSRFVDALRSGKMAELPWELTAHVEDCTECKKAIIQLNALMPHEPGQDSDRKPVKGDAKGHR